ncbi:MAG: AMP-binding protein [Thermodesulfobacteriota bacterium]
MIEKKLEHWAEKEPRKTALQIKHADAYHRITYPELWNLCLKAASQLRDYGINAGDHVALYGENSPCWAVSYLAIHLLGGVVVPLDEQLSAQTVLRFLRFSDTSTIIADENHCHQLEPLINDSDPKIQQFSIESMCGTEQAPNGFKPHEQTPDDPMSIIFTSGTTGTPKGVQLTCGNVMSNVEAVLSQIEVSTKDNILNILPLHHGFSCTAGLLTPLFAGATVTFSQSLKSIDLLSTMRETGITIFPGVPKLFTLLDREIFKKVDSLSLVPRMLFWVFYTLSNWVREATGVRIGRLLFKKIHRPFGDRLRFFVSGGAKLDPEVSLRFLNLGFLMLEGYGLTETSPVISITPPGRLKPGTAGNPIPAVEVRVDSPDTEGIGEICVRGPNIMKGYYKNDVATQEVIRDGWFHTGDLGMIDSDGNIVITGRAKEVIVLPSGKNIYPEDVEKHYENTPLVKELCVLPSYADHDTVKGLRMVVVPDLKELSERGVFNTRERIGSAIKLIGASLPSYMRITELVLFYGELPRTRLGKLRRSEIERLIKEQKSASPEEQQAAFSLEDKALIEAPPSVRFLKRLQEIADLKGPFSPRQDLLIDLGLDSLTLVEITVLLENEFGVALKEEEYSSIHTVGDILKRIKDASAKSEGEEHELSLKTLIEQPAEVPLRELFNLKRGLIKRLIMRIIQAALSIIVRVAFRIKVKGIDKIPKAGAVLLCPNHQSYIDPLLIFALLPAWLVNRLMFVAFGEFFRRPPLSWIVRPLRVVTTGSARTLRESLKLSYEALNLGMAVCIFPEGGRTTTGEIMPPRPGPGILSVETKSQIVPILIEGAIETLSPLHPEFRFPKVSITVGDAINPPEDGNRSKELYQEMVDQWKERLLELQTRRTGN